jgi:hypothetical protein
VRPKIDTGSATRAVALSVASVLAFATFSAIPRSPFQPIGPFNPGGPFVWFANLIHAGSMSNNLLVATGVPVTIFAVCAFLLLLREAWRGNVSLRTVLVLVVAYHVVVLMLPLLFSRDAYSYAFYGRIVAVYHGNPYVQTPLHYVSDPGARPLWHLLGPKWTDTLSVYGPLFSTIAGVIARISSSPAGQANAYRGIAIAASLGTVGLTAWTTRAVWPARSAFAVVAFGANPTVLFHSVASAHNDLLVALSVAGGLAFVVRGKELPAVAVLTLGALIKATGVLPLVILIAWCVARLPAGERLRAALTRGGLAAGIGLVLSAPYLQLHDPSLGMVALAGHQGWLAPSLMFGRLADFVSFNTFGGLVTYGFLVVLLVAFAFMVREVCRRAGSLSPRGIGAAWGWSLIMLMLLGPVLLPWYVVWALPVVWLVPRAPRTCLIATGVGLAVAQWVTEALNFPTAFHIDWWVGHWLVTPALLGLLIWVMADFRRRIRGDLPLEAEDEPVPMMVG